MNDPQRISALINLLDDPDEQIYSQVSQELLSFGEQIVKQLEEAWENSFNEILQCRIEQIIHQIQFQEVKKRLDAWNQNPDASLLDAAIAIAHYQYSDIDENYIRNFVDQLKQDCWIEVNDNYTAMEKVGIVNKIFFDIYGFRGDKKHFHSPANSFINNVLEGRKGNPISLSLLYLEVARHLKLPIYGVNLAEHFVLAYLEVPIEFIDKVNKEDVLFYINPFNKGTLFQYNEIESFVRDLKIDMREQFYLPCDKKSVVNRMLNNLIFCYHQNGETNKIEELKILKNCLKK